MSKPATGKRRGPTSLQFFGKLNWLDGTNLLNMIEPYRREIFRLVFDSFDAQGRPLYNMLVAGRGKKNWKSGDLVFGSLYALVIRRSPLGNAGLIVASDENQAADDLSLAKKLIACNPALAAEIEVLAKELRLRDGSGSLRIIPGRDVAGAHGKTYNFLGIDELHTAKDWSLLEALSPDPHRVDALQWITSYASLYNVVGAPLADLLRIGQAGTDKRMLLSWYSGDYCTDPKFSDLSPLGRANPSMGSWADGVGYLEQQRLRLPTGRFRRLHLNLPGAPEGACFDQGAVLACVITGRRMLPPQSGIVYWAYVDMSGGSSDDCVLVIGHREGRVVIIDRIEKQIGSPPFKPQAAIPHFAQIMREYGCSKVWGDAYGGQTFRSEFEEKRITYAVIGLDKSQLYEALEPVINAREVELPDVPVLIEQTVSLVWRGQKIDHEPNSHDDYPNAVAGLVFVLCRRAEQEMTEFAVPYVTSRPRDMPNSALTGGYRGGIPGVAEDSPHAPSWAEDWYKYSNRW
jgi:hypothetical protein